MAKLKKLFICFNYTVNFIQLNELLLNESVAYFSFAFKNLTTVSSKNMNSPTILYNLEY